jgi:hypothetical protein
MAEGRARIAKAQRRRWRAFRAVVKKYEDRCPTCRALVEPRRTASRPM